MKINTNFKDSVFTKLFSEPDLLRELYCALEGTTLPSDLSVSINTLENVVFMDLYNDISFEIGGKLIVLIEHQSTINPNMGLRLLLYISRVLEKIVTGKNLYSGNRLSIPWPEFFVLYNGKEPYPNNDTLRLSDLFEKPHDLGLPKKAVPLLDLEVKVININEGKNEAIVNRCKKLAEYSAFIAKTRSFEKDLQDREKAVKAAIKYCSRCDILKEFLEIHASEVLNMLLTEWNTEDALAVRFEEGMERGFEEGIEKGIERGVEETLDLIAQGYSIDEIRERLTYKTAGREDRKPL
ncbi:MAG: Rpn family recombination-promoting nuclease/putative transposase [Treponema sp.]|nr:Rpn family recombination-promoting nuclease/putative transposase [Treponema sp.]